MTSQWRTRIGNFFKVGALLLVGGVLNVIVVAFGIRDLFSFYFPLALAAAASLVACQYLLGRSLSGNGLLIGAASGLVYLFLVCVNLILAVSGIIAFAQPDALGRRSFEEAAALPRDQIIRVADRLEEMEGALAHLSRHSDERASVEARVGGTCGVSDKGEGPLFRLRRSDRDRFGQVAAEFSQRADVMRETRARLDGAIAGYSVERHTALASEIDGLVQRARQVASDPAIAALRQELRIRLEGVRGSTLDPSTGSRVRCPDPELERALENVLSVTPPAVPAVEAMPSEPNHRAAAIAFVREVTLWWRGQAVDWELWGVPTVAGLFPDAVFLIGIATLKRHRRRRRGISGELAEHITADGQGWFDAEAAARRAATDPRLSCLLRYHSRKTSWFGNTDFLLVPTGDQHIHMFLLCLGLVRIGRATYAGFGPGELLPAGAIPRPIEPGAGHHFFVLRRAVWDRLLVEAMRNPPQDDQDRQGPPNDNSAWCEAAE